jgi:hypothetical protein
VAVTNTIGIAAVAFSAAPGDALAQAMAFLSPAPSMSDLRPA